MCASSAASHSRTGVVPRKSTGEWSGTSSPSLESMAVMAQAAAEVLAVVLVVSAAGRRSRRTC